MKNKQGSTPEPKTLAIIPDERIIGKIYYIRGKKVMFDKDLAELYGVKTMVLNQAVKRNRERFPDDFMFQLDKREAEILKFHFGTSKKGTNLKSQSVISSWGGTRKLPQVFTEQGVAMLSSVLNSRRAIQVNIQIVRTFTKMRELLSTHKELRDRIEKMERENKENFKVVFKVLANFMKTDSKNRSGELRIIGFVDRKAKK